MAVEQGQQDEHGRTDSPAPQDSAWPSDSVQVTEAADGTSPAPHPDLLPPADEVVPVVPASQGRIRDHGGGLGQRQRLAAEGLDEVDRALALRGFTLSRSVTQFSASRTLKNPTGSTWSRGGG